MGSKRLLAWLIGGAVVLAAVGAGATYISLSLRERNIERDFQLASSFKDQAEYDHAMQILRGRLERGQGKESWYPRALSLELDIQKAQGKSDEARATAEAILDPQRKYSGEPVLKAHAFLGDAALDANNVEVAKAHFQTILDTAGKDGPGVDVATLGLDRIKMATRGASPEMKQELESLLARFPNSSVRDDIEFALGHCNLALLLSPVPSEGDEIYELKKGDTMNSISRKYKMPQDLLMRVNGISDPRRMSIGQRIKVPSVDFSIQVNKSNNTLTLLNHGQFFKRYRVRTGKIDYLTPVGDFRVNSKKKDPVWNDPKTGKTYPPNDPANELGTRWIGFQGASLGIHGTIRPETIGHYASNGCVGMLKEDVEELFDLVRDGTPIKITGTIQNPQA